MKVTFDDATVEKFWANVTKGVGIDDCWVYGDTDNYGVFYDGERSYRANRFRLIEETGVDPAGMYSCHKCDNKPCVRPSHLYWGTVDENNNDRAERLNITQARGGKCMRGHDMNIYGKSVNGGLSCQLCTKLKGIAKKVHSGQRITTPTVKFLEDSGYGNDYDRLLLEYMKVEPKDISVIEYRIVDESGNALQTSLSLDDLENYRGSNSNYYIESREIVYRKWQSYDD